MTGTQLFGMEPGKVAVQRFALFEYGFRPFFLCAAIYAVISVPLWVGIWRGDAGWMPAMPANLWHGHEMIFGFAVAALAGFMLTAVPNWTGAAAIRGPRLMLLVAVWGAGRVAAFLPWPTLFAVVDISFLPLLAAILGPGIIVRNGRRNGILVGILLLLATINSAVHFDGWGVVALSGSWALQVAVAVFALLIGIIGGRIVPAFTQGGMKMAGIPFAIEVNRKIEIAAVASLILVVLANLFQLSATTAGILASVAAILNFLRYQRWQGWKAWRIPLVWILHLGYGWLIVGLALTGVANFFEALPPTMGLHALTAGSFSTMILAVMSRASLGHTGRQLLASRGTTAAYLCLMAAASMRVVAPLCGGMEVPVLEGAALMWSGAFLIFLTHYAPMLIRARPDGRPG